MQYYLFVYCIFASTSIVQLWDLLPLGISSDNYRLEHVSLYFIRSFLCIQVPFNNTIPTLIESTWPENLLAIRPKVFPNDNAHAKNNRTNCNKLLTAKCTDIDNYGRLWVYDSGSDYCSKKIVIFDLLQKNKEVFRTNCILFKGNEVTTMKIDPDSSENGYYTAYFTINSGQYIIKFNLQNKTWQKLKVNSGPEWDLKSVKVHELAFTLDHRAYLADENGNLFVTNLRNVKNETSLHAKNLGNLLGTPKGLITDPLGVLYYILPKHGAIVRWEPSRTLNAEGHDILNFQSIPVVQILFGVQGSVWIATEHAQISNDHCYRILYHYSNTL